MESDGVSWMDGQKLVYKLENFVERGLEKVIEKTGDVIVWRTPSGERREIDPSLAAMSGGFLPLIYLRTVFLCRNLDEDENPLAGISLIRPKHICSTKMELIVDKKELAQDSFRPGAFHAFNSAIKDIQLNSPKGYLDLTAPVSGPNVLLKMYDLKQEDIIRCTENNPSAVINSLLADEPVSGTMTPYEKREEKYRSIKELEETSRLIDEGLTSVEDELKMR